MLKLFRAAVPLFAAGAMLLGSVASRAQQTPAAKPSTTKKPATTAKPRTGTAAKTAPAPLTTTKDKFSYALGMGLGSTLRRQSVEVDPAVLVRGLKDALAGGKLALTEEEARAAVMEVQNQLRQKEEAKMKAESAANQKEGEAFLAANKAKDGVVTLPSGLQYKVLQAGSGPKPAATDSVVCNYRGTLINGTEFDSSYKRGEPATFPVNGVIKGWTEALQLMPVGSKWQLFVPANLAYGERAPGPEIGPNSTLVFEVELLSIEDKTKTEKTPAPATEVKPQDKP
ncbi:MAG: FKBP-type peptidyl-prolyl cis-trans isomerase [Acidobacteria bacterium]|jgi:FKBP-type peptidyl-prolyl cis-trans isomerase|nr:FKBP-type peptidyl-prolyl cis-trans isomerase [Acidobacteriota bacterium]